MKAIGNRRTEAIVAGCMAALMMTATGAFADENDGREYDDRPGYGMGFGMGQGMGQGMGRGAAMRFSAIDQNNDGLINDDEAAANAEAVFAVMDADDDGELTEAEYAAVRMGPGDGRNMARQKAMQKRKADRFVLIDADKNKTVSQAEFMAAAEKRFAAADGNKDGKVTPWEFRANRRIF